MAMGYLRPHPVMRDSNQSSYQAECASRNGRTHYVSPDRPSKGHRHDLGMPAWKFFFFVFCVLWLLCARAMARTPKAAEGSNDSNKGRTLGAFFFVSPVFRISAFQSERLAGDLANLSEKKRASSSMAAA